MDNENKRKSIKSNSGNPDNRMDRSKEYNSDDDDDFEETDIIEESILSNLLILDHIFKFLTKSDLLKCALISKRFNHLSRTYLQKHRGCPIMFNRMLGIPDLKQLIVLLDNEILNRNYPFTGAHFRFSDTSTLFKNARCYDSFNLTGSSLVEWGRWRIERRQEIGEVHELLIQILERIPAKQFFLYTDERSSYSVGLYERFEIIPFAKVEVIQTNVLFAKFVQALLNAKYVLKFPALKSVSFEPHPKESSQVHDYFEIAEFLLRGGLPRLPCDLITHCNRLTEFLKGCPVLSDWSSPVLNFEVKAFVKANKASVIKSLKIVSTVSAQDIKDMEDAGLVLRELNVQEIMRESSLSVQYKEFLQLVVRLVRNSVNSLEVFHTGSDCISAIINSAPPISPLRNVRQVKIRTRNVEYQWRELLWRFPNAAITDSDYSEFRVPPIIGLI